MCRSFYTCSSSYILIYILLHSSFDEENKENGLGSHKRLTTADSVDSQSEGKSSDGTSEGRLGSEGSQGGSEERLASPVDPWTGDSGVDSLSGSGSAPVGGASCTGDPTRSVTLPATATDTTKVMPTSIQPRPSSTLPGPTMPKDDTPSNPNEVIIRLSINPSSDIFGFMLTQDGQKVIVESVDEG